MSEMKVKKYHENNVQSCLIKNIYIFKALRIINGLLVN